MDKIYLYLTVITGFILSVFAYGKKKEKEGENNIKDDQAKEQLESVRDARKLSERVASMPRNDVIKRLLERKTK